MRACKGIEESKDWAEEGVEQLWRPGLILLSLPVMGSRLLLGTGQGLGELTMVRGNSWRGLNWEFSAANFPRS